MTTPHNPRPWDILDLAEGYGSTDGAMPPGEPAPRGLTATPPRRHRAARTIRRIPTAQEVITELFRDADRWTRSVIRELARLGYDAEQDHPVPDGEVYSRLYLTNVGAGGMILVLSLTPAGQTVEIVSVTFGDTTWTAREAARFLKARKAR